MAVSGIAWALDSRQPEDQVSAGVQSAPSWLRRAPESAQIEVIGQYYRIHFGQPCLVAGPGNVRACVTKAEHGTSAGWHSGCRCTLCRQAHSWHRQR